MNQKAKIDASIEEILGNFNPEDHKCSREDCRPLSIWVPAEYKKKYDELQESSGRSFGKLLKQVIMKSIDKVG